MLRNLILLLTMMPAPLGAQVPEETGFPQRAARALFAEKVHPILESKCLACHGKDPAKIKGEFDMRSREKLLAGVNPANRHWCLATWSRTNLGVGFIGSGRLILENVARLTIKMRTDCLER